MSTIEKRVRNGKVSYRVRYRDPAGRQKSKTFARKVDADRWQAENELSKAKGSWVDPAAGKITFGEWAERWFLTTAGLKPSTRNNYRRRLENYVLPYFGTAPLGNIDPLSVREWQAQMAAAGLGAETIRVARAVLNLVLSSAVEGGRLNRNPASGVKTAKTQRREMHFLDAAHFERVADAIDPRYRVLVLFAAYSGLRPSEQTALRVGRLDLLRRTVRVCEAAVPVGGRLVWGTTKTGEARTIKLPRFLCDELGAYLADRPTGPDDLVFTMPLGGALVHSRVRIAFKTAVRAAGLPDDLRYYDLRHTAASLMIREGASVKAIQKQLGHATASMTLDTYGHLFPDELEAVADRLDQVRAAAVERATEVWPQSGPAVVGLDSRAGQ